MSNLLALYNVPGPQKWQSVVFKPVQFGSERLNRWCENWNNLNVFIEEISEVYKIEMKKTNLETEIILKRLFEMNKNQRWELIIKLF